ncbi:hypothetical protein SHIRM173S_08879 [Streptomyces hirsutus]
MDQRTSDRNVGATTEFERDVVKLLLATMSQVAKEEREDVGTESVLSALVSGGSAVGSAIAPGMKAAGSLGGSIGCRGTSVWVSNDAGARRSPDDEREIDAFWREVRQEQAKRLRWKNRKKKEEGQQGIELPPMTGALRTCLRKALETAREEGTLAVRVRHVAHALVELPDSRAREALVLGKLDVSAASAALDALRGSDSTPEPASVVMLRKSGTFGKSGNPLTPEVHRLDPRGRRGVRFLGRERGARGGATGGGAARGAGAGARRCTAGCPGAGPVVDRRGT